MNSKVKLGLILAGIVIVLAAVFFLNNYLSKIPDNDISITGNTAGNLNNNGLFCESDGVVYFSNAYDNNSLYSMNPDETDFKKLNHIPVYSINAGGDYLYYCVNSTGAGKSRGLGYVVRTLGLYRSKKNGRNAVCLITDPVVTALLCGNYIYYQNYDNKDFTQLFKIKTDKTEETLINKSNIKLTSHENGTIYFNGMDKDHYLYALNTATDSIAVLLEYDLWNPVYSYGYIYFMDIHENYRLCRYSLMDNTIEILTSDRIDYFNVGDQYIYYQKSDTKSPALKRMLLNGENPEIVAEGVYENINMTSEYVYFNEYDLSIPVYRTPVYGPVNVTDFDAALKAAQATAK